MKLRKFATTFSERRNRRLYTSPLSGSAELVGLRFHIGSELGQKLWINTIGAVLGGLTTRWSTEASSALGDVPNIISLSISSRGIRSRLKLIETGHVQALNAMEVLHFPWENSRCDLHRWYEFRHHHYARAYWPEVMRLALITRPVLCVYVGNMSGQ